MATDFVPVEAVMWQVPPEVQAERDIKAAAIKAQYEDPVSPDYDPAYGDGLPNVEGDVSKIAGGKKKKDVEFIPLSQVMTPPEDEFVPLEAITKPQEKEDFVPLEAVTKPEVAPPTMAAAMGQSVVSGLGALAHTGMVLGGGLVGLGSQEGADAIFKAADTLKEKANSAILSPKEQEAETFGQKIAGGVAGALPYVAAGLVTGPAAPIIAMSTSAGIESTTDKLARGADLNRAVAAGVIEAAGAAAMGVIPGVGKTLPRTLLLGAGTGAGQEVVTDELIHRIFAESNPDIAKQYEFSWEKTAVSAAVGSTLGAGFHGFNKAVEANVQARQAAFERALLDYILPELNKIVPQNDQRYQVAPGVDAWRHLETLIINGDVSKPDPTTFSGFAKANVKQILNLLSQVEHATPDQKALADALSRRVADLGLENVTIEHGADPGYLGHYHPDEDKIRVRLGGDPVEVIKTVLHETIHAILTHATLLYEKHPGGIPNDPVRSAIIEKVKNLREVYLDAGARWLKDYLGHDPVAIDNLRQSSDTFEPYLRQAAKNFFNLNPPANGGKAYGFFTLREFQAEILSNDVFRKQLNDMKLTPDVYAREKSSGPLSIKNMFQHALKAIKQVLGLDENSTMYHVAMSHMMGTMDNLTGESRGLRYRASDLMPVYNQKQASSMGELAYRRADFEDSASMRSKALLRRMANVLANSSTKDEAMFRMRAMSENNMWRDWVSRNIDSMWDHTPEMLKAAPKEDYSTLPKSMKRIVEDDRTLDELMTSSFARNVSEGKVFRLLTESEDLKGFGRRLFSPTILSHLKDGLGADIMRWVVSKAGGFNSMTEVLYRDAMSNFKSFKELPREDALKLMDVISAVDTYRGRQELIRAGKQWMDEPMLRAKGMNDAQVAAYKEMTKGLDFLHSMLNQALVKQGKEPIEQIPGYMPHVWQGAYKVAIVVERKEIDQRGREYWSNPRVVNVKGFNLRQHAEAFVKELEDGRWNSADVRFTANRDANRSPNGYSIRKHKDLQESFMINLNEHTTAYNNGLILEPNIINTLEKIEQQNLRGITKHILERSDVGGYLGQFGTKDSILEKLKIGSPTNNKILLLYENYAKSVTEYYRNTLFVDEVMNPLTQVQPLELDGKTYYGALVERTDEIRKHLNEFGSNFTGENTNGLKFVDEFLQNLSIKIGIDPVAYRKANRVMRNFLSTVKLRANPKNYVANAIQPIHALGLLHMVNAQLAADGISTPDPFRAFTRMVARRFSPDPDMQMAIEWARDNKYLEASLENELSSHIESPWLKVINNITGKAINSRIEAGSRTSTFMVAYDHFRNVFPDNPQRAREAAVKVMEMTMVNYDHMSRPLMYQNFGVVGEALSPFAVFRNGYIGNLLLMMKTIKGDYKNFNNWKPFIFQQMMFLSTAGVAGIIGAAEWNLVVNQLQKWVPETPLWDLPQAEEIMLRIGHMLPEGYRGAVDMATFGIPSAATKLLPGLENGVYLGASMNAVGMDDIFSAALMPFAAALGNVALVGAEAALSVLTGGQGPAVDTNRLYQAGKQLIPGIAQGYWDKYFMKESSDVVPKPSNVFEGGYEREQADWNAINWLGGRSIEEARTNMESRYISQQKKQQQDGVKKMVNGAVNSMVGAPGAIEPSLAKQRALEIMGDSSFAPRFDEMVKKAYQNRMISQKKSEEMLRTFEGERERQQRRSYQMGE